MEINNIVLYNPLIYNYLKKSKEIICLVEKKQLS